MSFRSTLALMILLTLSAGAQADLKGAANPPTFTHEEIEIIRRNAALSAVVAEDPWLVRQFLDGLFANRRGVDSDKEKPPGPASENPDLDGLERASPEALHDLIQRLKQAASSTSGQGTKK